MLSLTPHACPHGTTYMSTWHYMHVHMAPYACLHGTTCMSIWHYMHVHITPHICPHGTICMSTWHHMHVHITLHAYPYSTICMSTWHHIHVHMAPHACPLGILYDSYHVLSSMSEEVTLLFFAYSTYMIHDSTILPFRSIICIQGPHLNASCSQ